MAHIMPKVGTYSRHIKEIVKLMDENCYDFESEPKLQPIEGECVDNKLLSITEQKAIELRSRDSARHRFF